MSYTYEENLQEWEALATNKSAKETIFEKSMQRFLTIAPPMYEAVWL